MHLSTQALLAGLIDYAGLFPPAGLDMTAAVRNYAAYRRDRYAWMLGRLIVPVSRLGEFEAAAPEYLPRKDDSAWSLSAVAGPDVEADLKKIEDFNARCAGRTGIEAIELKADTPSRIAELEKLLPSALATYLEIPIASDPIDLIRAIAETTMRAKVRTGGVTADGFPTSFELARFIKSCADEDVAFKATAGLHHPLRSVNRLTYEPESPSALMHGFLNVFLAAAFACNGMGLDQLVEILDESSIEAFRFESGSVAWRDQMLVRGQLRVARSEFAISFGSCSFEEPIEDLRRTGIL